MSPSSTPRLTFVQYLTTPFQRVMHPHNAVTRSQIVVLYVTNHSTLQYPSEVCQIDEIGSRRRPLKGFKSKKLALGPSTWILDLLLSIKESLPWELDICRFIPLVFSTLSGAFLGTRKSPVSPPFARPAPFRREQTWSHSIPRTRRCLSVEQDEVVIGEREGGSNRYRH